MHDALGQVAGDLELGNELIGGSGFAAEVEFLEASLLRQDLFDLLGQDFVPRLFAVEELGPFRGVVDDLGDLRLVDGILAGLRQGRPEKLVLQCSMLAGLRFCGVVIFRRHTGSVEGPRDRVAPNANYMYTRASMVT